MKLSRSQENVVIGALVLGIVSIIAYRFLPRETALTTRETNPAITREVSTVASYDVPDGTANVRFTLVIDASGAVVEVHSTDAVEGGADDKLKEFSQNLSLVILGKKLSELTAIDRVGKSSLTTAAFNAALPDLQKQL